MVTAHWRTWQLQGTPSQSPKKRGVGDAGRRKSCDLGTGKRRRGRRTRRDTKYRRADAHGVQEVQCTSQAGCFVGRIAGAAPTRAEDGASTAGQAQAPRHVGPRVHRGSYLAGLERREMTAARPRRSRAAEGGQWWQWYRPPSERPEVPATHTTRSAQQRNERRMRNETNAPGLPRGDR